MSGGRAETPTEASGVSGPCAAAPGAGGQCGLSRHWAVHAERPGRREASVLSLTRPVREKQVFHRDTSQRKKPFFSLIFFFFPVLFLNYSFWQTRISSLSIHFAKLLPRLRSKWFRRLHCFVWHLPGGPGWLRVGSVVEREAELAARRRERPRASSRWQNAGRAASRLGPSGFAV